MPQPNAVYDVKVTADQAVANVTEVVVATVVVPQVNAGGRVRLSGWVQLTTGTATTFVTPRIRRGVDATGTLIGEANPVSLESAVGGTDVYTIEAADSPAGELAQVSYVLTVQQTAATAPGSALQASLQAFVT